MTTIWEGLDTLQTSEYPTRYAAFDHPLKWCIAKEPQHRGGFELVVYHEPMGSGTLFSGIAIEVVSYQGTAYLVKGQAFRPTSGRPYITMTHLTRDYQDAVRRAIAWLPPAQDFCRKV